MDPDRALDAAIVWSKTPKVATAKRSEPLPAGVGPLLRVPARKTDASTEARQVARLHDDQSVAIATHYVLQLMIHRGSAAHKALGMQSGADRSEIRRNMRLVLLWLQPDWRPLSRIAPTAVCDASFPNLE